ncbi:MAG: hypothetical protein PF495_04745, partial [Spirochaetales bacterium]|nr:hypothetical protein [Spirochaetales bacterium]
YIYHNTIDDISDKLFRAGFSTVEAKYSYGKAGSVAWKLTMKYNILALNTTRLFFILFPFYYLIAYPIAFILNHIDAHSPNKTGTGLIVKAVK